MQATPPPSKALSEASSTARPKAPTGASGHGIPYNPFAQPVGPRRGRPWVGRSYLHLALPVPALDAVYVDLLDRTLGDSGWTVRSDEQMAAGQPILSRRWSNGQSDLVLIVLGWYPLLVTIGAEGRAGSRLRKAERRLAEAVVAAGGREVADRELDDAVAACRARWPQALAARRTIEEHSRWLECRGCRTCGAWSAYGALHCNGCARRFAPEDDAERNERGRVAAEATAEAERQLMSLGRGEGLFHDWPAVTDPEPIPGPGQGPGPGPGSGPQAHQPKGAV